MGESFWIRLAGGRPKGRELQGKGGAAGPSSRSVVHRLLERSRGRAATIGAKRWISSWLIQLSGLAALVVIWQLLSMVVGSRILPGFVETARVFVRLVTTGDFVDPLLLSVTRTISGFLAAFAVGLAYGVAAGRSRGFNRITSPLFQIALFANTLVLVLWGLVIFGSHEWAAVVITMLAVFPTISIYMRDVVRSVDIEALEMASAYRASRAQRFVHVYLPHLAPTILATSRIGFSTSWKIVTIIEVFGLPSGIGWRIQQSYAGYNLASVLAWLAVFLFVLVAVEQLIRFVERSWIRWV